MNEDEDFPSLAQPRTTRSLDGAIVGGLNHSGMGVGAAGAVMAALVRQGMCVVVGGFTDNLRTLTTELDKGAALPNGLGSTGKVKAQWKQERNRHRGGAR